MSDTEDVPELSAEAKAFLRKHQATGEPSAEGLERGRQRVVSLERGTPSRRRPLFPAEVMAAAAVVTLLLGAQGLYLALRTPPVPEPKPEPVAVLSAGEVEVSAIAAAWTAGDLDTAGRLASKHCQTAACRPVATELTRALGLAARLDTLMVPELDELASFDAKLSGGKPSAMQERVDQRRHHLVDPSELSSLTVAVGAFSLITADRDISRVAIGDPEIADVTVAGPRTLRVQGMSLGRTTLLVWFAGGPRMSVEVETAKQGPSGQTLTLHVPEPQAQPEVEEPVADAEASESTIPLAIGDITDLKLKGDVKRVAVGDPAIADVSVSPAGDIRVEGKGDGRTTLLVWFADGERQSLVLEVKAPQAPEELVQLAVGGGLTFPAKGPMRNFSGGNPDIATVRMLNKQELRIEGMREGKTTVLITSESDAREVVNIEVRANHDSEVAALFDKALKAKARGDTPTAFTLANSALRLDPRHDGALRMLRTLRMEARESYLRGYQLRDAQPEEARAWFQNVIDITPPDDETHLKAKSRLRELTPP